MSRPGNAPLLSFELVLLPLNCIQKASSVVSIVAVRNFLLSQASNGQEGL